ncbi:hypothetical protein BGZ74_010888 [Mortierella antarctica]|nr:hypothetical protein BGZ74_010888 [Mortierella antarctica]
MPVPADTVLVHIPTLPSIRSSENLSSSTSSKSNLAKGPVDAVIYRHGRVEDAPHMTEMQFSNYLFHYPGIAPKFFLDTLDYPAMTANHAKRMAPPVDERPMAYVVAERQNHETGEGEVIGMSQAMVPDWERAYNHRWNPGWEYDSFDCEIDTLYVKLGVQGGGVGRKLILGACQEGYDRFKMRKGVIIWTLLENLQAHSFYRRIGYELAGIRTIDLSGCPAECAGFAFRDIEQVIGKKK